MIKGDIILIPFPFTNLIGKKLRPSVILISGELDLTSNSLIQYRVPFKFFCPVE